MAKFPTGGDAILASAEAAKGGGGKKYSPELFWRDGDVRYIQFLTPLNDVKDDDGNVVETGIPTAPVYTVKVGTSSNGKAIMRTLIDPRPTEGKDAYNPLADRFGIQPRSKQMAVAVELEPVFEKKNNRNTLVGFEVMERTFTYQKGDRAGEEVTVPNVGLIINTHTFFKYLTTWEDDKGDIRETPFKVVRVGGDKNTQYNFLPFEGKAVELGDEVLNAVNLDDAIDMYMSPERYHELIDPRPDDHDFGYAARKDQQKSQTAAKNQVADSPTSDQDVEPDADEEAAAAEKFNKLRDKWG